MTFQNESSNSYIYDENLFNKLRLLRLKIAREKRMPAYIVFPDSTLMEIVAALPETEEEFSELKEFIKWVKFDRLGAFAYSAEEGTGAALLPEQLDEEVKVARQNEIMEIQREISETLQKEKIGRTVEVLCEGYDEENLMYFGRSQADSLDVDGMTYFAAEDEVEIGEFVVVRVLDADQYDCTGVQIEKEI